MGAAGSTNIYSEGGSAAPSAYFDRLEAGVDWAHTTGSHVQELQEGKQELRRQY